MSSVRPSLCPVGFLLDDVTSSRGSTTATSLLRALTSSRSAPSSGAATGTSFCMATFSRVSSSLKRWCRRMIHSDTIVGVLLTILRSSGYVALT